jgi:hypothetical protein
LLGGGEFIVEDHDVSLFLLDDPPQLFDFAFAQEGRRVDGGEALGHGADHDRAGGDRETVKLLHRLLRGNGIPGYRFRSDQDGPFGLSRMDLNGLSQS